jgi:hypothetical protein
MGMTPDTFWNISIGLFLDLWACHQQYIGREKPYKALSIDDVIPN